MSNNVSSIMAATYLDQLCETVSCLGPVGSMYPSVLEGSLRNPLQAMRLISMDAVEGMCFDSKTLAQVTGVPAAWLDDEYLNAPLDEVIPALGRMALIYLSSLRNAALADSFKVDAREECLKAEATFAEVLKMNGKLAQGAAH